MLRALPAREDHRPGRRQLLRRPQARRGHLQRDPAAAASRSPGGPTAASTTSPRTTRTFVSLVERAGCMELDFGGESGSERMQELRLQRRHGRPDRAGRSRTCTAGRRRIDPFVSWLSGLPGETYDDMEKTFDLMDQMAAANPRTQHYGIFLYTPFPSPLLDVVAGPSSGRRSRSRSGATSRSSTSSRPGTRRPTSRSCGRSRPSPGTRSTRSRASTSTASPSGPATAS